MSRHTTSALIVFFFILSCCNKESVAFLAESFIQQIKVKYPIGSLCSTTTNDSFRISSTIIPETQPLAVNSLAGKIERALVDKFGHDNIERVVKSWRLLDQGYEHREFIEKSAKQSPESSFAYQHAPSYVPGLTCRTFWPADDNVWAQKLKKSYKQIFDEFQSVTTDLQRLQQDGNNIWTGALTKEAGAYGEGWKTLVLMNRGMWDRTNCKLFPRTARFIRDSGIPAVEVFFASMKPNSAIKMHSDFTNFVLTSHLALDIPENGKNKCRITVGDDCKQWINGEMMLFDTSIMHDAVNEANASRYILMFRVWHPELTKNERDALQFIYDCLEYPDLLSEDTKARVLAQKMVSEMRTFPAIQGENLGFGTKRVKERKN